MRKRIGSQEKLGEDRHSANQPRMTQSSFGEAGTQAYTSWRAKQAELQTMADASFRTRQFQKYAGLAAGNPKTFIEAQQSQRGAKVGDKLLPSASGPAVSSKPAQPSLSSPRQGKWMIASGGGRQSRPVVQCKGWTKIKGSSGHYYWDSAILFDPAYDKPCPGIEVPNPHAPINRNAGNRQRTGNGGFALSGGYASNAVFPMLSGSVSVGTPSVAPQNQIESIDYGNFSVMHHGVTPQHFPAPTMSAGVQPAPNGLPALSADNSASFVTADVINAFAGQRKDNPLFPSQIPVMHGMSAQHAVENSGGMVPFGQMDWLHRHRFTHGGEDHLQPQQPENLVAGTHGANIRHLTLENAVTHAVPMMGVVPVGTSLHNPISPENHVYGQMGYTVHSAMDTDISQTSMINLTDPQMPRRPDQDFANIDIDVFNAWSIVHDLIEDGSTPQELGIDPAQYEAWLAAHKF